MRLIKGTELARRLGLPRRTVVDWIHRDPSLAVMKDGVYWIKLEKLADKPGMDLVSALTLPDHRWIKAVDLALISGVSRRTVAYWCKTRPQFARRLGRLWYVDLELLGATEEQIDALRKWTPEKRNTIAFLEGAAEFRRRIQERPEQGAEDVTG